MSSDEFKQKIQEPSLGKLVEMFHIDLTPIGYDVHFRWVPSIKPDDEPVIWQGETFSPAPILANGFEYTGQGAFPRPKLQVSNILQIAEQAVQDYEELLGAEVTRWRVFEENLDNGSNPDENAHFPKEVYRIDRRSGHNAIFIEFELASILDQEGTLLPRRQVLKVCSHTYRVWNAETEEFDYTNVTCPYLNEARLFDKNGNATSDPASDACSKLFGSGCRARFGREPLPFRGFMGVQRRGY